MSETTDWLDKTKKCLTALYTKPPYLSIITSCRLGSWQTRSLVKLSNCQIKLTAAEVIEEESVLLLGLEADQVHAVLSAEVPALQPVALQVLKPGLVLAEEIIVAATLEMFRS